MTMTIEKPKYEIERAEHTRLANHAYDICKNIKTEDDYHIACDLLLKIKDRLNRWEKLVEPVVSSAKRAHFETTELRRQIGEPLKRAEQEIIKPALARYEQSQERIRKAQEEEVKKQTGMDIILPNKAKTDGITFKTNWAAKVVDMKKLVGGIMDGKIPVNAVSPNMPLLHNMAKNFKTALDWPGVEVYPERIVSARKTYGQEDY